MLRNYLITTLRNFRRNKVNTLVNVAGLALSIACGIFIYAFVKHEYTFDDFHSQADHIYRIVSQHQESQGTSYQGYVAFPLTHALRQDFPELEYVTQVYNNLTATIKIQSEVSTVHLFEEREIAYADEYFLKTFDYELLAGSSEKLLVKPDEVILTKKLADKLFANEQQSQYSELIGRTLFIDKNPYQVSAILQDIPRNTNITFRILLPIKPLRG